MHGAKPGFLLLVVACVLMALALQLLLVVVNEILGCCVGNAAACCAICDGIGARGCDGTVGFAGCGGKVGFAVVFGTSLGVGPVGIAFTGV